jgi:hypothetical protein
MSSVLLQLGEAPPDLRVHIKHRSVTSFAVDFFRADGVTALTAPELVGKTAQLEIGAPGTPLVWQAAWDSVVANRAIWNLTVADTTAHGSRTRTAVLAIVTTADRQVIAAGSTTLC